MRLYLLNFKELQQILCNTFLSMSISYYLWGLIIPCEYNSMYGISILAISLNVNRIDWRINGIFCLLLAFCCHYHF